MTKYPKEIFASIRENKSLAILAQFTRATAEKDDGMPLAVYDNDFSRFVFSGIDSENKRSNSSNIPVREVANIFAVSEFANTKHLEALYSNKAGENVAEVTSPAYTVKITAGALRGKTPAEVLLTDPENGKNMLNNQFKWLKQNLDKYPKNQIQMDAISEAARLHKEGKLDANAVNNKANRINIYHADARALIRKPRADGMCPVHNIDIGWELGEASPVDITITTFYAPVKKTDDGRINPMISQMDKTTYVAINKRLTAGEWLDAIRRMKTAMLQFEVMNSKACIEDAAKAEKANREAAGVQTANVASA